MRNSKSLTAADWTSITRAVLAPIYAIICLANVFFGLFGPGFLAWRWLGWLLLGVSDKVDGILARKFGSSKYGPTLDEMSDKACMFSAFIVCIALGLAPWYWLVAMMARDIFMIFVRNLLRKRGDQSINSARWPGKVKTVLQFATIVVAMLPSDLFHLIFQHDNQPMSVGVLAFAATVLSVGSAIHYCSLAFGKPRNKR